LKLIVKSKLLTTVVAPKRPWLPQSVTPIRTVFSGDFVERPRRDVADKGVNGMPSVRLVRAWPRLSRSEATDVDNLGSCTRWHAPISELTASKWAGHGKRYGDHQADGHAR